MVGTGCVHREAIEVGANAPIGGSSDAAAGHGRDAPGRDPDGDRQICDDLGRVEGARTERIVLRPRNGQRRVRGFGTGRRCRVILRVVLDGSSPGRPDARDFVGHRRSVGRSQRELWEKWEGGSRSGARSPRPRAGRSSGLRPRIRAGGGFPLAQIGSSVIVVRPMLGRSFSSTERWELQQIADATFRDVRRQLDGLPPRVMLVVRWGKDVIPETGESGAAAFPGNIGLTLDPDRDVLATLRHHLRPTLAHELHSSCVRAACNRARSSIGSSARGWPRRSRATLRRWIRFVGLAQDPGRVGVHAERRDRSAGGCAALTAIAASRPR